MAGELAGGAAAVVPAPGTRWRDLLARAHAVAPAVGEWLVPPPPPAAAAAAGPPPGPLAVPPAVAERLRWLRRLYDEALDTVVCVAGYGPGCVYDVERGLLYPPGLYPPPAQTPADTEGCDAGEVGAAAAIHGC